MTSASYPLFINLALDKCLKNNNIKFFLILNMIN